MAHAGEPDDALRSRVAVSWQQTETSGLEPTSSPNGAYALYTRNPDTTVPGPWDVEITIDVERPVPVRLALRDVAGPVAPRWLNEKLVFLRAAWGRVLFTDLIVDAEAGTIRYQEVVHDGTLAWQQYRGQCLGQCPCLSTEPPRTLDVPPVPRPAPGEPTPKQLESLVRTLAFLDGDWDGRVFTEPGATRYVVSSVKGSRAREEYDVDIVSVRAHDNGWWLEVKLYGGARCDDPNVPVVHRGWVAAYDQAGRAVAWHHPGGC